MKKDKHQSCGKVAILKMSVVKVLWLVVNVNFDKNVVKEVISKLRFQVLNYCAVAESIGHFNLTYHGD